MGRRDDVEIEQIKKRYLSRIHDPEFRGLNYQEQGEELGVSRVTVSNWRHEISAEEWQKILDMTRKQAAEPTLRVDDALLKAATGRDVQAMKLWYEIHGWSPKQINENLNKNQGVRELSDEELAARSRKRALDSMSPEELEREAAEKRAGVIRIDDQKAGNGG